MQKAVISRINRVAVSLRMKKPPLARAERDLIRAEKLIELYEPFILNNEHVFECENARLLSAMLPAEERPLFELRAGIHRLVGTTGQRAHSGAAPLVLSVDGRPPARIARAARAGLARRNCA